MAAAIPPSDSNVCFAELIVRLDSLLTLRDNQEGEVATEQFDENEKENLEDSKKELEVDIKRKLTELHLRLKNGGSIHDRAGGPGGPGAPGPVVQGQQPLSGPAPIRPPPPPYTGPGPKVCIFYLSPIEIPGSPIKSALPVSCLWNRDGSE